MSPPIATCRPKLRFPEFQDAGEWKIDHLGQVADFVSERIQLEKIRLENYVSTENILPDFGGVVKASNLPTTGSVTRFKINDVLVSNIRPYLKKVWQSDKDGGASNDVIVLRAKQYLMEQFFSFILRNDAFIDYVMKGAKGVKMPRGDVSLMRQYPIGYPSPAEQKKIADCLSSIDELITLEAQKLDTLKTHKKRLMQQLFPRDGETLPKLRFPEFRDAREWIECDFYDLLEDVLDFRGRTPLKLGLDWGGGNIISLSANNVKNGYIDFDAECNLGSEALYEKWMGKVNLEKGDIVFTMEAPLGNALLVPDSRRYILSQRVVAFKTKKDVSSEFLIQLIWSPEFQNEMERLSTGSTAKGINQKTLKNVSVRVPSEENEQQKIASCLESLDDLITAQTQKLAALKTHKQGLMQQLFPSFGGVDDETERGGHPVGDEAQG